MVQIRAVLHAVNVVAWVVTGVAAPYAAWVLVPILPHPKRGDVTHENMWTVFAGALVVANVALLFVSRWLVRAISRATAVRASQCASKSLLPRMRASSRLLWRCYSHTVDLFTPTLTHAPLLCMHCLCHRVPTRSRR